MFSYFISRDIWFPLVTGRKDKLGLRDDTIPATAIKKLNIYTDSINQVYSEATPEVRQALENDIRLEYLMIIDQCADIAGEKGDNEAWEQYLSRVRNAINMSDPANARNPFFAQFIANSFFFKDNFPDGNFPQDISPDSLLQLKTDYYLKKLSGKAAESASRFISYVRLDAYLTFDGGMRIIVFESEILIFEAEDIFYVGIDLHPGELARFTGQLSLYLFKMIQIDVGIPQGMYKLSRLKATHLRNHHREQCITRNIERNPKETVTTTLIELQGELAITHIKLKEGMTRR